MKNINNKGLCYRCEHRIKSLENAKEGVRTGARMECGQNGAVRSCYMYKPVIPIAVEMTNLYKGKKIIFSPRVEKAEKQFNLKKKIVHNGYRSIEYYVPKISLLLKLRQAFDRLRYYIKERKINRLLNKLIIDKEYNQFIDDVSSDLIADMIERTELSVEDSSKLMDIINKALTDKISKTKFNHSNVPELFKEVRKEYDF